MSVTFELFLLDSGAGDTAIALGRCGNDSAIERVTLNGRLDPLVKFGRRIGEFAKGGAEQLTDAEIGKYGKDLFDFLFPATLRDLFLQVSVGKLSLQILSDHSGIKEVPWEFIVTPTQSVTPNIERSVVRVHPTRGLRRPFASKAKALKVLFVTADPIDQSGVPVADVLSSIQRAFKAFVPSEVEITVVEGATQNDVSVALAQQRYDVFHFYGHGEVRTQGSGLLLQGLKTKNSTFVTGKQFASLLAGRGVQLAILSACNSGAGNHNDALDVVATALIEAGIPAVLANQYPIHYMTIAPFLSDVYAGLITDGNIDDAVAAGRVKLYQDVAKSSKSSPIDWGIPVLYRFTDARQLFDL